MKRILIGLLVLASGCGDAGAPASDGKSRTIQSNGGSFSVTFESTPNPIPMNALFDLTFKIAPQEPGRTPESTVVVDARMPAHFHGMTRAPKLGRLPDGTYKAEGMLFHMPGHWELTFDVTQGGKTERAQADIDLK